jgi:hypothetical protein
VDDEIIKILSGVLDFDSKNNTLEIARSSKRKIFALKILVIIIV